MRLTLPTLLTLFRIALLPVIVVVFYLPEYFPKTRSWSNLAAAGIFILAGITDWLDGWIARRYNLSSAFGAFLDPVADKLMVAVALFLIVQQNPTALMAVSSAVIVGREISISALREWMAELGQRAAVSVAWIGKFKTMMQIVAIVVCLHQRDLPELRLYRIGEGLLVLAAVLTIWSAFIYVRAAWPIMRDADSGKI
ncbi:MAG: CDP-diacylglycerol--glycerol-3-phosphate 3-phosphatidyltransferase [Xanthomonadales bacterium]|uniref:CDP-diacylglycerol--glycerol-3-phosphate 3-phosphatidyltransferase n=2 Tax=Dokdonella sp. TaxID=2291710 RepID=UPI002CB29942|nr:CDP-diacylglycerol--glycerol-3-phosphate 3-phosphatidyltransferase [Xanthomonadales bacterium]HQV73194.1 CDP-diacylglycerol--glycerol-3-phosphate 3-phosphatidyltransferase [Dokdonella sp.]MBK7011847.1 CDP-diacylglycerol--glycerol-3-phosphate 3-phosphatidyltransferase [Xanthomonadales bacterium]MBK7209094.1 CDP-diacylglycerol--glycerol-3-phosphate 3-phosphatidyltransferase [Xanthomonadales bacterium]MBL0222120.1 CDP-diacylglycerol--glycerol-3-phosphate 3-phosphatidyltransferase [Xanthomonadal